MRTTTLTAGVFFASLALAGVSLAQTAAPGAMGDPMGSHDAMSASPMSSSAMSTPMASHDAMSASPMSHTAKAKKAKTRHQASAKSESMPRHP